MEYFDKQIRKDLHQFLFNIRMPVIILALLLGQYCMAQTDSVFKLTKEHGHFFCETAMNGVNAKAMVETGIPGLMMSEAFYEAHKDSLKLEVKESDEKIRYHGGLHHVKYTAQARLQIGDAFFKGPVKIIQEDQAIMIPIHMLHHSLDSSAIVWLELGRLQFRVCSRERLQNLTKKASVWPLTYNLFGMPVITTSLRIKAEGHHIDITGQFIADLGNASLLFLNRYDTEVDKLMSDSKVHLVDIYDNRKGQTYSQAFYVDKLTICDRTYKGDTVGVSTFKGLEECGILGLKFFTMPAVFDFDKKKCICVSEILRAQGTPAPSRRLTG